MGKTYSDTYSKGENKKKYDEEFKVIKNETIYNIKLSLCNKDEIQTAEITISFVLNREIQIYKAQFQMLNNPEQIYSQLINEIKNENYELIHNQNNE